MLFSHVDREREVEQGFVDFSQLGLPPTSSEVAISSYPHASLVFALIFLWKPPLVWRFIHWTSSQIVEGSAFTSGTLLGKRSLAVFEMVAMTQIFISSSLRPLLLQKCTLTWLPNNSKYFLYVNKLDSSLMLTSWIQHEAENCLILVIIASCRHEAELAATAAQPLPDDDDEAFE
ncbi:hypothetical protein DVH24_024053 [Malus domestica]|uniref:Uncharacterized protein n=1 Tax=Malus domestica TaxID=3750 RepID=A0A498JES1_MALDO|nr:hypothetical protein DVH24_024053 [Malus domestica]